jgi:hypothetical protein
MSAANITEGCQLIKKLDLRGKELVTFLASRGVVLSGDIGHIFAMIIDRYIHDGYGNCLLSEYDYPRVGDIIDSKRVTQVFSLTFTLQLIQT